MKNEPAVVVLAAGAGSRYRGTRHKLSEQLGGDSVLVRTLRNAIASEMSVVLVISEALIAEAQGPGRARGHGRRRRRARKPAWGMGDSIAAGVSIHASATRLARAAGRHAAGQARAACARWPTRSTSSRSPSRSTAAGAAIRWASAAELFSELVMLKGDEGARRLLARYPTAAVELDDPGVLFDIDTVDDLAVAQRRIDGSPTSRAESA